MNDADKLSPGDAVRVERHWPRDAMREDFLDRWPARTLADCICRNLRDEPCGIQESEAREVLQCAEAFQQGQAVDFMRDFAQGEFAKGAP